MKKTQVQSFSRISECDLNLLDRELKYIINFQPLTLWSFFHVFVILKIFLFFALGFDEEFKFQLFNFTI